MKLRQEGIRYSKKTEKMRRELEALTKDFVAKISSVLEPTLQSWGLGLNNFDLDWWVEYPTPNLRDTFDLQGDRGGHNDGKLLLSYLLPEVYECLMKVDHTGESDVGYCLDSIPITYHPPEEYVWLMEMGYTFSLRSYTSGEVDPRKDVRYIELATSSLSVEERRDIRFIYGPLTRPLGERVLSGLHDGSLDGGDLDTYLIQYEREEDEEDAEKIPFY